MKSTVETKINELVKLGHELAKELHCAESAALVSDLASQLEVQFARSNALAAKLSMINGLMDAAEQSNKLAQEATEKLVQEREALAAENAGLKADQVRIFNSGYQRGHEATVEGYYVDIHQNDITTYHEDIVAEIAEEDTPATDAFLAEVRNEAGARAVELFAKTLGSPYSFRDEICYEDGFARAIEVVRDTQAPRFAAQLRKGVQS